MINPILLNYFLNNSYAKFIFKSNAKQQQIFQILTLRQLKNFKVTISSNRNSKSNS